MKCTQADTCVQGECVGALKSCDDGKPCTADACAPATGGCSNVAMLGCCAQDSDCDDGDAVCTVDTCVQDACVFTPAGGKGCCYPVVWAENFDNNAPLQGWTIVNTKGPGLGWQKFRPSLQAKSPPGALYYGDPVAGDYDMGGTNSGTATSPPIELPDVAGPLTVTWQMWADVEDGASYDKAWVDVLVGGDVIGGGWTKQNASTQWTEGTIDVTAFAGQVVQIRFMFDTTDDVSNSTEGFFIDNVVVDQGCP